MRKVSQQQRALAQVVRAARKSAGLSARQLSRRMNRAPNYISRIEASAQSGRPALDQIAKALGLQETTLLNRAKRA